MLTGLQEYLQDLLPPPKKKKKCLGYFLLISVGVANGNVVMNQPSVWDTILELYEMSPKINYFDLASQCHIYYCCFVLSTYMKHVFF